MMQTKPGEKVDVLESEKFRFPLTHLDRKEEHLVDILQSIDVDVRRI